MQGLPVTPINSKGASADAFAQHPGYRRMFAHGQLTLGIFLPLRFHDGDMVVLRGQAQLVKEIDRLASQPCGYAMCLVRPGFR